MNLKDKTLYLSIIYVIVSISIIVMTFIGDKHNQIYIKPLIPITLGVLYTVSVKKINPLYILVLLAVMVTHYFLIFHESHFIYTLYSYLLLHTLIILIIYKKFLLNKSFFDILTFASPYFIAFLTIFFLIYENLNDEVIPIFIFGSVASINGSVALLNYSQKEETGSYLIFIGIIIIIAADISSAIYRYDGANPIYYQCLVIFDIIGQYCTCKGIILIQQKIENKNYIDT